VGRSLILSTKLYNYLALRSRLVPGAWCLLPFKNRGNARRAPPGFAPFHWLVPRLTPRLRSGEKYIELRAKGAPVINSTNKE
jgi:hypothetical protein